MKMKFQNIGVMGKPDTAGVDDSVLILVNFLKSKDHNVFLEDATAKLLKIDHGLPVLTHKELGAKCDLLIVVGGDGCMLSASRIAIMNNVPLVGINRGRLGFLTDIMPDDINIKINEILQGKYFEEKRFLLEVCQKNSKRCCFALNDVVLTTGDAAQMIEFEIYIDNRFMCSVRSDGMIISTPTGSTAYSLSAGGPILLPTLDAIALVPMFPHSLTNRPIVIDANSDIRIDISGKNKSPPRFTCDGKPYHNIKLGNSIHIRKIPEILRLIHPIDYDYFGALRGKLHWGKKIIP